MKKIILALAIILTVGITSAFANETTNPEANSKALATFKREFAGVKVEKWESVNDISKAVFILNGGRVEAYFNSEGEFMGTARNLLFTELPLALSKAMTNPYADA